MDNYRYFAILRSFLQFFCIFYVTDIAGMRKSATVTSSSSGVKADGAVRVYGSTSTDNVFPGSFIPYCNISQAQLSFHGHKDAIKFFVAVPGFLSILFVLALQLRNIRVFRFSLFG